MLRKKIDGQSPWFGHPFYLERQVSRPVKELTSIVAIWHLYSSSHSLHPAAAVSRHRLLCVALCGHVAANVGKKVYVHVGLAVCYNRVIVWCILGHCRNWCRTALWQYWIFMIFCISVLKFHLFVSWRPVLALFNSSNTYPTMFYLVNTSHKFYENCWWKWFWTVDIF